MSNIDLSARKPKQANSKTFLIGALVALATFAVGLGVGSGRLKITEALSSNQQVTSELPADLNYTSVESVYDSLRANYDGDLTEQELLDGIKSGLASATGDPYTEYFNAEEAESFGEELNGTFSGIGAELGKKEDAIVIIAPLDGFPAQQAGLRSQDIISKINGEPAFGISVTEAVNQIRGPVDTEVTLTVIRNESEELEIKITRAEIKIPSVKYEIKENSSGEKIGYLKVSRFGNDTISLATEAAQDFKKQNVAGVILDVRSDPGGLLDASVDLASLWLPKGATVLEEKRADVTVKTFTSSGKNILDGIPTIVLINEGSASASEITAGALRDNGVAQLVGVKSFGKGSVQSLVNLGDDSLLKVTIARWYTPSGTNIDKEGLEPDVKVEFSEDDYTNETDPQLDKALELLK